MLHVTPTLDSYHFAGRMNTQNVTRWKFSSKSIQFWELCVFHCWALLLSSRPFAVLGHLSPSFPQLPPQALTRPRTACNSGFSLRSITDYNCAEAALDKTMPVRCFSESGLGIRRWRGVKKIPHYLGQGVIA
jgi:hypothetical protein